MSILIDLDIKLICNLDILEAKSGQKVLDFFFTTNKKKKN